MTSPRPLRVPLARPTGRAWPPDESWSLADLVGELQFWRNYSALAPFARSADPALRITPYALPLPPARVPRQRGRQDARWDRLVEAAFNRSGPRQPPARPRIPREGGHP